MTHDTHTTHIPTWDTREAERRGAGTAGASIGETED